MATAWRAAALVAALLGASTPTTAAQEVSGVWNATWAQGVRTRGSELVEVQRWGAAHLTLTQDGARVTGTWWTEAGGVTWQVAGTFTEGRLSLTASEHDSDDPELSQVTGLHWRGTLTADGLEGEMWMDFAGLDRAPTRRPWRATRAPG